MDQRAYHILELAKLMTETGKVPDDVQDYLNHNEFGLALDALNCVVNPQFVQVGISFQ